MTRKIALIVAAGKGRRMMSEVPKQFLLLNTKPVLMHTIEAFWRYDASVEIVVVLPPDDIEYWQSLCQTHGFDIQHRVVAGASERFGSVLNALRSLDMEQALVAVHDGVRPLVSQTTIGTCFDKAASCGNAIPVVDAIDSLRMVVDDGSVAVERSKFKSVQTPQVFDLALLKSAYDCAYSPLFTDDASVLEHYFSTRHMNQKIVLVEGNRENIKITSPIDIAVAECLLNSESPL